MVNNQKILYKFIKTNDNVDWNNISDKVYLSDILFQFTLSLVLMNLYNIF